MLSAPIRILHVDSARRYRGGQNQVRTLLSGLSRRGGFRQALVAARDSRLALEARDLGIEVRPVSWKAAASPAAAAGIAASLREPWDMIHAHDGHGVQLAVLARCLTGAPVPLVAARRVDFPVRRPGIWRRADRIIAVSGYVANLLATQGVERTRIEVVHDGIDPADLEPRQHGVLRSAAGVLPGGTLVAAVGALVAHKDHATFVRAASRLAHRWPRATFAVFGEGPRRRELEALIAASGLDGRFRLPGYIRDAVRALDDLDVFVMPSREEGLGTSCIEAMLAGRPVVATSAGGLAELAGDAFDPVQPGDPEALAGAIDALLSDETVRAAAAESARRRGEHFSADAMVERTIRSYARIGDLSIGRWAA